MANTSQEYSPLERLCRTWRQRGVNFSEIVSLDPVDDGSLAKLLPQIEEIENQLSLEEALSTLD